jgi:Ca-activated chloride channel family protein
VLLHMLETEQPRSVPGESETNISDAIVLGLHRLQAAGSQRKVLVLLSDGEHNVPHPPSDWTPRQAAQIAANLHVPISTIDAGGPTSSEREPGVVTDTATIRFEGHETLQKIAHISKGRAFAARDTRSLVQVCQEIDRLERAPIQSFQYRRFLEAYPWLGGASFLMWLSVCVLEMTWWRRLP